MPPWILLALALPAAAHPTSLPSEDIVPEWPNDLAGQAADLLDLEAEYQSAQAGLSQPQHAAHLFPPGWNGRARTPPMGWRSWNAFGAAINTSIILANIQAITAGGADSLAGLGYTDFGIDEGWESCSKGSPPGRLNHDRAGQPTINSSRFGDLAGLVQAGHNAGLQMGWYLAGCACGETIELERNYAGDIDALSSLGFDAVKFDNCGAMKNLTLYAELMQATGKSYTVEACHWGHCWDQDGDPDASGCPTQDWCPFNLFRTSGDVASVSSSWLHNLQTTSAYRDLHQPLSRPHCWAYPDMLEVGMVEEPAGSAELRWNRAHFGGWAVSSSPLVIGADVSDSALLARIMPIVGNKEAIAVNQAWHGHPGRLVGGSGYEGKYPVVRDCLPNDPTQQDWSWNPDSGTVRGPGGLCLDNRTIGPYHGAPIPDPEANQMQLRECDGSDYQKFILNSSLGDSPWAVLQSNQVPIGKSDRPLPGVCSAGVGMTGPCCVATNGWWDWNVGPVQCQSGDFNAMLQFKSGRVEMRPDDKATTRRCWSLWDFPASGYEVQHWAKPVGLRQVALLVINSNATHSKEVSVPLSQMFVFGSGVVPEQVDVRDIWAHTENGTVHEAVEVTVQPADSAFLLVTTTDTPLDPVNMVQ